MTEAEQPKIKKTQRLMSLDAYRGAIMIVLISHGFGFYALEGHPYLNFLARHTEHVQWSGCVFWDLIQPAFMFMVGVAMPFAFSKRRAEGQSEGKIFAHVLKRAFMLWFIAVIFGSIHAGELTIGFVNVLPQIAFGYVVAYFFVNRSYWTQGAVAVFILIGYTLVWMWYPGNGPGGPWAMGNQNLGSDFDMWSVGRHYPGYWVALNAIPSTSTIIAGVMCGKLVSSDLSYNRIMAILAGAAAALMASGLAVQWIFGIPIVKRILTSSFALYSTGWAILFLLLFFWLIEVANVRRWAFFLVVVGMNSIAAYIIFQLFRGWINNALLAFTRPMVEEYVVWGEIVQAFLVLGIQWYVLYFFYKKRIFFKV